MGDEFDPYYVWLGIPPEEQPADHYRLIGVRRFEANLDVISNAADQRMQYLRNAQVGKRAALSQKLLNEIAAARNCLLDPQQKAGYDQQLRLNMAPANNTGFAPPALGFPYDPLGGLQGLGQFPAVNIPPASRAAGSNLPVLVGGLSVGLLTLGVVGFFVAQNAFRSKPAPVAVAEPEKPLDFAMALPPPSQVASEDNPPLPPPAVKPETPSVPAPSGALPTVPPIEGRKRWWADPLTLKALLALEITDASSVQFPGTHELGNLGQPLTAELWLRCQLAPGAEATLLGTQSTDVGRTGQGWRLLATRLDRREMNGELILEQHTRSGERIQVTTPIPSLHEWHQLALVVRPGKTLDLYLDGRAVLATPISPDFASSGLDLRLGQAANDSPASHRIEICGLRLSTVSRDATTFLIPPPNEMAVEQSTIAFLPVIAVRSQLAALDWRYGVGEFDQRTKRVTGFEPFRFTTGSQWQAGAERPDPQQGWISIDPQGGHTGNDERQAAIRRWTASQGGNLKIAGVLEHAHETRSGDGVRGRIVTSRRGLLGEWKLFFAEAKTLVESEEVQPGDTVDFVVDCTDDWKYDSFGWVVDLELKTPDGSIVVWNSLRDFSAQPRERILAPQLPLNLALPVFSGTRWLSLGAPSTSSKAITNDR